jgi:hypothetical protein
MTFRDNLWNLGDEAFRICLPNKNIWVFVLKGKYWGLWRLTKTKTTWQPIKKNPWTLAWSLKFNGETTSWCRKDIKARLRESKPAQMFTGLVRKWTKDQSYVQRKQWLFSWAKAVAGREAVVPLMTWHADALAQLQTLVVCHGIAYRTRLAENLAKHQPTGIVALLRKQHPRATRKSIKMLLYRSEFNSNLFSATPSLTAEDLKQRDYRFATGYGNDRYKSWLAVRRLYPRRPHLVREVLFLKQHFTEHVNTCGLHQVVMPEEIHFDTERLPNSEAVRRMEERIRNHKARVIEPILAASLAEQRRRWQANGFYDNYDRYSHEDKRAKKLEAHHRDLPLMKGFMDEPEGVELLVTSEDFQIEGNTMKHCVGMYANDMSSFFYKIDRPEGRATLQIVPMADGGHVRQLYGKYNQPVSPALKSVIYNWATEQFAL